MLHQTRGLVLKNTRYGDTSLIVNVYTEKFGIQSYLVQGIRNSSKRYRSISAGMLQAGSLLDLVVYHIPNKNLQRIREARFLRISKEASTAMIRNALLLYIAELLYRSISEPEPHPALFDYIHQQVCFIHTADENKLANQALVFTWQLASHLGFGIQNRWKEGMQFLDLEHGAFCTADELNSLNFIDESAARILSLLLDDPLHKTPAATRKLLLNAALKYMQLHVPHMKELKSVPILQMVLG